MVRGNAKFTCCSSRDADYHDGSTRKEWSMRRILLAVFMAIAPLSTHADSEALGLGLNALARGDLGLAAQAAGRMQDPVALDILSWTRLRRGEGSWQ
jgi:soluble lytic murein transglycosylase